MSSSEQTVFRLVDEDDGFNRVRAFREPVPVPAAGEALVKVRSVALNYRDVMIAKSVYPAPLKKNVVPCCDMAGEVVAFGSGTTGGSLAVGDAVIAPVAPSYLYGTNDIRPDALDYTYSSLNLDGVLREYLTVPINSLIKLPACKTQEDFTKWAATPCTVSTAWNALYGNTPLKPGDTVLALGTGGVSISALILAKAAGATTIVTSSSDEKLELVKKQLGVDHGINYKTTPEWAAEVQRLTGGKGADHIIEVGGTPTLGQSLAAAARGGLVSILGFLAIGSQGETPDIVMISLLKALTLRGLTAGSKQHLEEAVRFMSARGLALPVDKVFAFKRDEVIAALNYVESGSHVGKVCITVA